MECRKALEQAEGDLDKARRNLKAWAEGKVEKLESREVREGAVVAYIHPGNKVGALVELSSETDFVARNEEFKKVATEIAMQVASMEAKNAEDLMEQEFIKDPDKKISDLVKAVIAKTGENIRIGRIYRIELGK